MISNLLEITIIEKRKQFLNERMKNKNFSLLLVILRYLQGKSENGPANEGCKLSCEFRFSPRPVRSVPRANVTRFGSDSAARMNVSSPTIPN